MAKKKRKFNNFLLAFVLAFLSLFTATVGFMPSITHAEELGSNVLTDLQKDETFNVAEYPVIENDYSLQVIQIAESTEGELLVYVYQPSGKLRATTIRFSTGINDKLHPKDYSLTYLNSSNTLFKYKVQGFKVSSQEVRYYEVIAIHRKYIEGVDEPPTGEGQVINEVAFEVGNRWSATTLEGTTYYTQQGIKTVEIKNKWVGRYRYRTPLNWTGKACDAHFVAFSTEFEIERLREAEVTFYSRTYKKTIDKHVTGDIVNPGLSGSSESWSYGNWVKHVVPLERDKEENVVVGQIFTKKFTWNQIETIGEFEEGKSLSKDILNELNKDKWVLNFYATDFAEWADSVMGTPIYEYETGTEVDEVSILRLKYYANKQVFNVGVVDNKQTGSIDPVNPYKSPIIAFLESFKLSIPLIAIAIALIVLFIVYFKQIMKGIGVVIKWIFTLPWQLLK